MKRGYTVESYREMIEQIRQVVPGAAVTSDFIVGFCGETEDDFQQTVDLVRWARFKNSFIFKYSPRPGTRAAELYADDVPEEVKRRRNNELAGRAERHQPGGQSAVAGPRGGDPGRGAEQGGRKQARGRAGGDVVQLVGRTVSRPHRGVGRSAELDGPAHAGGNRDGGRLYPVRNSPQSANRGPPHADATAFRQSLNP